MPRSDIVRKAIALGRDKGFLTFGELNELWPSTMTATGRHRGRDHGLK